MEDLKLLQSPHFLEFTRALQKFSTAIPAAALAEVEKLKILCDGATFEQKIQALEKLEAIRTARQEKAGQQLEKLFAPLKPTLEKLGPLVADFAEAYLKTALEGLKATPPENPGEKA